MNPNVAHTAADFKPSYFKQCAEQEGARALACLRSGEKPWLVGYFAASAVRFARMYRESLALQRAAATARRQAKAAA